MKLVASDSGEIFLSPDARYYARRIPGRRGRVCRIHVFRFGTDVPERIGAARTMGEAARIIDRAETGRAIEILTGGPIWRPIGEVRGGAMFRGDGMMTEIAAGVLSWRPAS